MIAETEASAPAVGQLLRSWREYRGLSMRDLERASGISKTTIFAVEHGTHDPRIAIVTQLFAALGVVATLSVEECT